MRHVRGCDQIALEELGFVVAKKGCGVLSRWARKHGPKRSIHHVEGQALHCVESQKSGNNSKGSRPEREEEKNGNGDGDGKRRGERGHQSCSPVNVGSLGKEAVELGEVVGALEVGERHVGYSVHKKEV